MDKNLLFILMLAAAFAIVASYAKAGDSSIFAQGTTIAACTTQAAEQ
jgi:hypothetical protein